MKMPRNPQLRDGPLTELQATLLARKWATQQDKAARREARETSEGDRAAARLQKEALKIERRLEAAGYPVPSKLLKVQAQEAKHGK